MKKADVTTLDLTPFKKVLAQLSLPEAEGVTTIELAAALGIGEEKTRRLLAEAHRQGLLITSKIMDLKHYSGRPVYKIVYRLKTPD